MGVGLKTYSDALDFLYARTTGVWKLGLERVEGFLGALGDPHRRIKTIHVAGTNGKGSVCATLEATLRAKGLRARVSGRVMQAGPSPDSRLWDTRGKGEGCA